MSASFFIGLLTGSIITMLILVFVGFKKGYIRVSLSLDKVLGKVDNEVDKQLSIIDSEIDEPLSKVDNEVDKHFDETQERQYPQNR